VDGTDEYGDKLANGVYLYKVDIRDNQLSFNFENMEIIYSRKYMVKYI
jgi:hypothetical protein